MNALTTFNTNTNAQLTMSSREIAELTGKEHFNVMRDIREMLEALGEVAISFEGYYTASNGKKNPCYNLPRHEVEVLLTGYNVQLRSKVLKRLRELEEQAAKPAIPQNFAEALRLAAEIEEQRQALLLENEAMKPAAAVGNALGLRKEVVLSDFVRKLVGVNTQQVTGLLSTKKYIYKREGRWAVYSTKREFFGESYDHKGASTLTIKEKGMQKLVEMYHNNELVMLKGKEPVARLDVGI